MRQFIPGLAAMLFCTSCLAGADVNTASEADLDGIKGIGPKTALKLVKEHPINFAEIFQHVEWDKQYPDLSWTEIFETIKNIPVTDNYQLEWKPIQAAELRRLLIEGHNFNAERVNSKIEKLEALQKENAQKGLKSFF